MNRCSSCCSPLPLGALQGRRVRFAGSRDTSSLRPPLFPTRDGSRLRRKSVEAVMALRAEAVTNDRSSGRSLISVLQGRGAACAGH